MFSGQPPCDPPSVLLSEEFFLGGTFLEVRRAVADLRDTLQACATPDGLMMRVEIAVSEALNNVVEHALTDVLDGRVRLSVKRYRDRLVVTIRDVGKPMPSNKLPQHRYPDTSGPAATLPEGGFGWALAHSVTDAISYARINGVNTLEMVLLDDA